MSPCAPEVPSRLALGPSFVTMFEQVPERVMNSTVNAAPRFSPALEAVRRPPCASMTERLIASPRPNPPCAAAVRRLFVRTH